MAKTEFLKRVDEGELQQIGVTEDSERANAGESSIKSILKPSRGTNKAVRVVSVDNVAFGPYLAKGIAKPEIGHVYPTSRIASIAIGAHINSVTTAMCSGKSIASAKGEKNWTATVHGVTFVPVEIEN